jgi:DNA replication ATP-dependent helicase Dna2
VLSDAHPEAISELARQYRMNEDIMTISNTLIYDNKLQCGSDQVAKRGLYLPNPVGIDELHRQVCQPKDCWLERLLAERCFPFTIEETQS